MGGFDEQHPSVRMTDCAEREMGSPSELAVFMRWPAVLGCLIGVIVGSACGGGADDTPTTGSGGDAGVAAGTARMSERLALLEDPSDRSAQLHVLRSTLRPSDLGGWLLHGGTRAGLLLQAGRADEAAIELRRMQERIAENPQRVPATFVREVYDNLALAALWGAVQAGCLERTEACLFPPAPAVGAEERLRAARTIYETFLREQPGDLLSRWLLNLTYMALGQYPDSVPLAWRIPAAAFESEQDIGRFPDRAAALGLDVLGHAGGSVMDDFDGDGDLDLMASSLGLADQIRFFRNDAGQFADRTGPAGLRGLTGGLNLVQADYDNDGDIDVFILRGAWYLDGQPNSLLRNDGDGTFEDVTEEAGVLTVHPTQAAAWGDFDNDGWLDLFIGNESYLRTRPPQAHPWELYRNNGDGTFADVAAEVGLGVLGFVKAATWGDYDNDGRLDLFLSRLGEENNLFHNEGPMPDGGWRFEDRAAAAEILGHLESFRSWFWDYDNDGWPDLFSSGYRLSPEDVAAGYLGLSEQGVRPRLYRNRGDGTFEDVAEKVRLNRVLLTMGSNFGDLDNDGWLDLYIGTGAPDLRGLIPNRMFRNDGGRRFLDITASGGFGHLGKGHAVAFGDLDNDGDQDVYAVIGGAVEGDVGRNVLFENPGHGNRWLTVRLEGVESNRSAIGARLAVTIETDAGLRTVHSTVGSDGGFGGSSLQQEIGLGQARSIRSLVVLWPSGRRDTYESLPLARKAGG